MKFSTTLPALSQPQLEYFKATASQVSDEVVQYAQIEDGPIAWKLVTDEKYVQIYSGVDKTAPEAVTSWLAASELHATLEEVVEMLDYDEATQYHEHVVAFHDDIKEAKHLYTIEKTNASYIGVSYQVQSVPNIMVKHRDFCFVESRQEVTLCGRRALVCAQRSIQLACCPNYQQICGLVRADHFRSGCVYLETDVAGVLQVVHLSQVQLNGDLGVNAWSKFIVQSMFKRRFKSTVNSMERALRAYRLSQTSFFVLEDSVLMMPSQSNCIVCKKNFSWLLRRVQCQKCAEVVCNNETCSSIWHVNLDGSRKPRRICTFCSIAPLKNTTNRNSQSHQWGRLSLPLRKKPSMSSTERTVSGSLDALLGL